jgi:hypothetical protein
MSQRISLNLEDFTKLVRGEIVAQGDLMVALQCVSLQEMHNAVSDAIAVTNIGRDEHWLSLDEAERQMVVLAFAELSLSRPGWNDSLLEIAQRIDRPGAPMFARMKTSNADRVRAERSPLVGRGPVNLHEDDEDIRRWIHGINQGDPVPAGSFLHNFAAVVCQADFENYPLLRPSIIALKAKFPKYCYEGVL